MIRRPPRSTLDRSSAASDVYKRQGIRDRWRLRDRGAAVFAATVVLVVGSREARPRTEPGIAAVSYTHLRAHETVLDLVCRLLLEKNKNHIQSYYYIAVCHTPE